MEDFSSSYYLPGLWYRQQIDQVFEAEPALSLDLLVTWVNGT